MPKPEPQPPPPGAATPWFAAGEAVPTERLDADPAGISRAACLLQQGRLVAFGTETVYGLGADATNPQAVAAIFRAKGRPSNNPLIAHFADASAAFGAVEPNRMAHALAEAFWPGPLTLVLPRRSGRSGPTGRGPGLGDQGPNGPGSVGQGHDEQDHGVCALAAAGLPSLAVRVPNAPAALDLLRRTGRPIAAPSANRSGRISPSAAAHVLDELDGAIDAVLDSGPCRVGVESTILDLCGATPLLLRPGGVTQDAIEAVIGPVAVQAGATGTPRAPGQFASHYAPVLPLRLDATAVEADEALLSFGAPLPGAGLLWRLSDHADLVEAASELFAGLRVLDRDGRRLGLRGIAVMPIPAAGLGQAIRDRLLRASAPRPDRLA